MNPHKPPVCLVSHTLGLLRDTTGDNKEQELTQGMKENSGMATARLPN